MRVRRSRSLTALLVCCVLLPSRARAEVPLCGGALACSAEQITAIRAYIRQQCGGSGTATVICTWMGWELRDLDCSAPAPPGGGG